mgnify:CR=1 FL=1
MQAVQTQGTSPVILFLLLGTVVAAMAAPNDKVRDPNVPVWNTTARVIYSKAYPGFMDIEVYRENGRYFVRDKIKPSDYKDSRPRRFYYVDMANVGPSLEKGYPLPERGGIYQVQCKRWREGKDQWDLKEPEVAMEWIIKPGPLGADCEEFIPDTFQLNVEDWRDQHHKIIPPFQPIAGKASPCYRYNIEQTWNDILSHGATQTAGDFSRTGPTNALLTIGDPIDTLGEQGFEALSIQEIQNYASNTPAIDFYLTDWEKQAGWHNTQTYWSIDLPNEKVLQKYYLYVQELNRLVPTRKTGDYYRALKWSNSFYDEGEAYPLKQKFIDQTTDPESHTAPAFRKFRHVDGSQHTLREVCRVYTIDWYLKSNIFPDRRRTAIYQVYANLFDTINVKRITPADSTILGFAWFGTDNDLPYRQYLRLENGWMAYYNRIVPAAWWVMDAAYISHLFGDGFHWWHDDRPEGVDRRRHPENYGMGDFLWEPDSGAPQKPPFILGIQSELGPLYPREPRYNVAYSKLAEYRIKQFERFLSMPRSVVEYSLDGGKTWVTQVGNETRDILEKTEKKQPLCFQWNNGKDETLVFVTWPFAEEPEWLITLRLAPGVERTVKMHRQWPMLQTFSRKPQK